MTSDQVKIVHHLEKDRTQLTCFGETLNLSKANSEPQLMGTVKIPHNPWWTK